jgi:hypothetical protein
MDTTLHDIVHWLTIARAQAQLFAEQHPEHYSSVQRFEQELQRAQRELISRIRLS